MKWKRSKKAAMEAKKGHENNNNNNNNNSNNKEQQNDQPAKDGKSAGVVGTKADVSVEQINGNHSVTADDDDDDDVDMDESDIDDDDDVIDVADDKQQALNHACVNPFRDQSGLGGRDMPTDLSVRHGPTSLATTLPQSQHLLSRV